MNKSTEMNERELAFHVKMIEKACGNYLTEQDFVNTRCKTLYDAYQKLKGIEASSHGFDCYASDYVDVVERFDHLTVADMIDSIESSLPIENDNLPEFMKKIDWALLKEQKACLVNLTWLDGNNPYNLNEGQRKAIDGIVHLIDSLQDYAVDDCGLEEERVFQLTHDDEG